MTAASVQAPQKFSGLGCIQHLLSYIPRLNQRFNRLG